MIRRRRPRGLWSPTIGSTGWAESTFAEEAWNRSRRAVKRWAIAGGLLGGLGALVAFAPASWLASAVTNATGSRVQLADARGTAWSGSAVLVLTGGAGSRDAAALPGRIEWTLGLAGTAIEVKLRQACCLNGTQSVRLRPRFGGFALTLPPAPQGVGQWPTAWLTGLGTPWNALNLGGTLRIATPGLTVESVQGRWRVEGRAEAELLDVTSRLVPLPVVGSYRVSLAQDGGGGAAISLATKEGALQLSGTGNIGAGGLRFRGEARAEPGQETALNNLLNIIGRRDGARSVLSIG